jgi:outer membrane lipoprotein-sorting protein
MSHRQLYFLAGLVLAGWAPAGAQSTNLPQQAAELFAGVEQRFEAVQTLQYTVNRTSRAGSHSLTDRWTFRYQKPDLLRIDYEIPQEHVLIRNRQVLWEYIPAARKALRTDLSKLSDAEQAKLIAQVFARVAVSGLRPGNFNAMAERTTRIQPATNAQAAVATIEGADPKFFVQIDVTRKALLRTELYNANGEVMLTTMAGQFLEVVPGFWVPQTIQITQREKDALAVSTLTFSNIKVNEALPAEVFQFTPSDKISVSNR